MGSTTSRPDAPTESGSARAAWWVGAGIFLSRIAGYVRDAVIAGYLGTSRFTDVWVIGLRTPNVIQNLLGEGTLSASFIPVYASMLEEGREEEAGRFAGAALGLIASAAYAMALLGVLLAPVLVPLLYFELDAGQQELLVTVIRILMPMTATFSVSAWALGVLNTHRRFFVSYVAPVMWNVAIVGAIVGSASMMGDTVVGRDADLVLALSLGGLVGALLQLGLQLPFAIPALKHFRLSVSRKVTGIREAIRNLIPVVLARGAVNLSALLDAFLAALLTVGAVTSLQRAQTLYVLPISLFGMAVAAAELPELSRERRAANDVIVGRVRGALRRVAFLLVPSVAAYLTFGDVLVEAVYGWGRFGADDTRAVQVVLAAYALGLLASGSSRTLSSTFFALRDTATPAKIAGIRVLVSAAIGIPLMFPLDRYGVGELRFGAAGLALGASVAAWLEYALLRRALRERLGPHGPGAAHFLKLVAAALIGVGAALLFRELGEDAVRAAAPEVLEGPLAAAGTAACFGSAYLASAALLGAGRGAKDLLRRGSRRPPG